MTSNSQNNSGFTLIELLIAIVILTFVTIGVYQTISNAFQIRESVAANGEFYNTIRLAMNILDRDISNIYTPRIMLPEKKNTQGGSDTGSIVVTAPNPETLELNTYMRGEEKRTSDYWGPVIDKTGVRNSHFIGKETKLNFVSAAHVRVYRDSKESIFSKIAYQVEADPKPPEGLEGTNRLIRIENPFAFDMERDEPPQQRKYVILKGIKRAVFRFYRKDKKRDQSSWDSLTEETTEVVYPDYIELDLQVAGTNNLNFEGKFRFKPEIPLDALPTTY